MSKPEPATDRAPLLWDQHACLPLRTDAEVEELARYARRGGCYVSINVGYAPHSAQQVLDLLAYLRRRIDHHQRLVVAAGVSDVEEAHQTHRVAVAFDLEDCNPVEGELDRVRAFYELGVRSMAPVYNVQNAAGSGCLDPVDTGLTAYGRDLVRAMNAVGMLVDGSHCSVRTGLDMCEASEHPVIYSHSCLRSLWDHPRNLTDAQVRACATTGGVVGIAGVGIFLGPNTATVDAMVRHIDHAVSLVGPDHVGLGSDYCFDLADLQSEIEQGRELFPDVYRRWGPVAFVAPEGLQLLGRALAHRGYPETAIAAILGGNFLRVAGQVWKPPAGTGSAVSASSGSQM